MEIIPKDILIREIIEKNLSYKDIDALCMVSKYLHEYCKDEKFWEYLLKNQFDYEFWIPFTQIPSNTKSFRHLYMFFDRQRNIFTNKNLKGQLEKLQDKEVKFELRTYQFRIFDPNKENPSRRKISYIREFEAMYGYKTPLLIWKFSYSKRDENEIEEIGEILKSIQRSNLVLLDPYFIVL